MQIETLHTSESQVAMRQKFNKLGVEIINKSKRKEEKEIIESRYLGTETWVNQSTGEVREMQIIEKRVNRNQVGWNRVYLESIFRTITELYDHKRRLDVIAYIVANLDSNNKFTIPQKKVKEDLKIANATITETYKRLIKSNFMKKVGLCYMVNVKMINAYGSDKKNIMLGIKYNCEEPTLFDNQNLEK